MIDWLIGTVSVPNGIILAALLVIALNVYARRKREEPYPHGDGNDDPHDSKRLQANVTAFEYARQGDSDALRWLRVRSGLFGGVVRIGTYGQVGPWQSSRAREHARKLLQRLDDAKPTT